MIKRILSAKHVFLLLCELRIAKNGTEKLKYLIRRLYFSADVPLRPPAARFLLAVPVFRTLQRYVPL